MNILRLKYLLAVATSGSFSEAAEQLFTTQSAVSKQIIALEKELNVKLFDRSKRKIALTEEGRCVLPYAQRIIEEHAAMMSALAEFESYEGGRLSIASIPVMAQYGITGLVAGFRGRHPTINMHVEEKEGGEISSALENRECELAFVRRIKDDHRYESIDLFVDNMVLIVPVGHPYASNETMRLSQLKDEQFLFLNKGTLLYDQCVSACESNGFTPNIAYTGTRMENIVELVASGMGISLMMDKAVSYIHNEGVCRVPLEEQYSSTIALIRVKKKKLSAMANLFWDEMISKKAEMNW